MNTDSWSGEGGEGGEGGGGGGGEGGEGGGGGGEWERVMAGGKWLPAPKRMISSAEVQTILSFVYVCRVLAPCEMANHFPKWLVLFTRHCHSVAGAGSLLHTDTVT